MNLIGTVNILDRGDGPAQEVLSRTARNRAQRKQDETRNELNKITDRVDKTLGQFELVSKSEEESRGGDDAEMKYVSDVDELYDILSDQIKKRKYQQQVTVFIVGYQNASTSRLKLMQQVNEFFNETTQRWEDGDLNPTSPDIDLEEAEKVVSDTLDTAKDLTQKISDINKEMMDYMYQYANAKAGNKNRKKMEKALSTAKEDLQLMSEKIVAAQKELDEKDEKIQMLYKQIEVKSMEAQKFKTAAEVAKTVTTDTNPINLYHHCSPIKSISKAILKNDNQ
ncbi:hypothetical protein EB796_023398 [Bugula neritina]|uniref:Uncharacterized protein n=1 Tax=Bugula neritina TaxID=10212 RepID=A0A7J7IWM0_BUGNE|nr:hypothetical protein EB796_023398 [Bugula neritina]